MDQNIKIEFILLYEPIHEQLTRYCRAIAGNVEDAEDLMHDTVLNTIENFQKIKDKSAFKAFMFSIACNLHKKKQRRQKFRAEFNEIEANTLLDISQDPEYEADFQIIYEKILALPSKTSEALILFHITGLKLEEIQKIQGGSLSAVKLRIKRGREKLLEKLQTPEQVKLAYLFLTL